MAMVYATVTGQLVIPGTTDGVPGSIEAVPLTEGKVLTFPAEDITTLGPAVAQIAQDGTLTPPLEIPTDVPEGTLWRFTFKPKGRALPTHLGDVAITASTDIADLNLSATEVTHVTPTVAANIAAAAALGATNDSATASFVENEASETHAALSATYGTATADLSAGNVTLTAVGRSLDLVGATASRVVTLPDTDLSVTVTNSTDYAHTLIRSGASVGVPLPAGDVLDLRA